MHTHAFTESAKRATAMAKKSKGTKASGPDPSAVKYNGAIRGGAGIMPDDTIVARLSLSNSVTGSASLGVSMGVNNIGVTSSSDWAGFAATYGEFRVLGFQLDYLPYYPGGNAAVTHAAGFRIDTHSNDTLANLTVDQMVQHADWVAIHTGEKFSAAWKMDSEEEAAFLATASPPSGTTGLLGSVYAGIPGATSASTYGLAVYTYVVQFRDRK